MTLSANSLNLCLFATAMGVGYLLGRGKESPQAPGKAIPTDQRTSLVSPLAGGSDATGRSANRSVARVAVLLEDNERMIGIGHHDHALRHLLRQIPLADLPEVASFMAANYRATNRPTSLGDLLHVWAERDPTAALAWYEDGMPQELDQYARKDFFRGWATNDGEAALAYIGKNATGAWATSFRNEVFAGLGEYNPALAQRLLLAGENVTPENWKFACFEMGRADPAACLNFLNSIPKDDPNLRERLDALFAGITNDETLRRLWETLDEQTRKPLRFTVEQRILKSEVSSLDGTQFLELYRRQLAEDPDRCFGLLSAMSDVNPDTLLDLVASGLPDLPDNFHGAAARALSHVFEPDTMESVLRELLSRPGLAEHARPYFERLGFTESNWNLGFELLQTLEGKSQAEAAGALFRRVADGSIESTLEQLARLDAPESRQAAEAVILSTWARKDPAAAAAWYDQRLDGNPRPGSESEIAREWAAKDPASALDWARSTSRRSGNSESLSAVLSAWTAQDAATASAWMATLPESDPDRNALIGGLIDGLVDNNAYESPEESMRDALTWLQAIHDPAQRENTRVHLRDGMTREEFERELSDPEFQDEMSPEMIGLYRQLLFGP